MKQFALFLFIVLCAVLGVAIGQLALGQTTIYGDDFLKFDGNKWVKVPLEKAITITNYIAVGDWLKIETDNFGYIARSKREPFLVSTNGEWPWLIRFYDPKLETEKSIISNATNGAMYYYSTNWSYPITDSELTNYVNKLVSSGEFCRVRGHNWQMGCGMMGCLVIHGGPTRHCPVCGKMESQQIGPWK